VIDVMRWVCIKIYYMYDMVWWFKIIWECDEWAI